MDSIPPQPVKNDSYFNEIKYKILLIIVGFFLLENYLFSENVIQKDKKIKNIDNILDEKNSNVTDYNEFVKNMQILMKFKENFRPKFSIEEINESNGYFNFLYVYLFNL